MESDYMRYFHRYNQELFEGKLENIDLIWSNRLTTSAGIFYPDKKKPRELGKICLSRKILINRSEHEIRETLLHEMIHAYLQILHGKNIKPHGKEFTAKADEINKILNLNIKSKHNFLKWWRCTGQCRQLAINLYGYVSGIDGKKMFDPKREAVKIHTKICGGKFEITSEPNNEMLQELRRLKRNRSKMIEEMRSKRLCDQGVASCKDCKSNEILRKSDEKTLTNHQPKQE